MSERTQLREDISHIFTSSRLRPIPTMIDEILDAVIQSLPTLSDEQYLKSGLSSSEMAGYQIAYNRMNTVLVEAKSPSPGSDEVSV